MVRRIAPILLLIATACSGADRDALPVPTVLVTDSVGRPSGPALSPDGTRLAWTQPTGGKAAIYVGNADGTNPVRLTFGAWDTGPVWSPDGRWIAYGAEDPDFDLMIVPSDGGERRQLSSGPGFEFPLGWTPDGNGVVFLQAGRGEGKTFVAPLDGSALYPLAAPMTGDQVAFMSPDGSKVAFQLDRGAERTIWVQDARGGGLRQLTTEGFETFGGLHTPWSPDGRHLVYASRRTGTQDLWVLGVDGGSARQLTHDVRDDIGAVWSPDGRWIAFTSDRGGQWDVWVVPADSGSARRVTNSLTVEGSGSLRWSRDGKSLIFASQDTEGGLGITVPDGGAPRMLVNWPGYSVGDATLSPDGATVIFTSDRSGNADLWSVSVAGGEPVPLAASPLEDLGPRYSPDGSQVLFTSNRGGSYDLWVMPAAGGEARRLTDWPSDEGGGRWSPDGSRIAFQSNRDGTGRDIWIIPSAGGTAKRVTRFNSSLGGVEWSPDGRSLYATVTDAKGVQRLYRIPADGGTPVALQASLRASGDALSPDGSQYAYSSLEGGFAFVEVTPTSGGPPRRITQRTADVYQTVGAWSPDGTRLAVESWLYGGNDATTDVVELAVADGAERRLTQFPRSFESPFAYTKDGTGVLFTRRGVRGQIVRVSVEGLLAR